MKDCAVVPPFCMTHFGTEGYYTTDVLLLNQSSANVQGPKVILILHSYKTEGTDMKYCSLKAIIVGVSQNIEC